MNAPRRPQSDRSTVSYPVASRWPLVMGVVSFGLSVVLAVITMSTVEWEPIAANVALPLADTQTLPLSVGGYVLTPLLVFTALVWDRVGQRSGLRDRNFVLRPRYASILTVLSVLGFILAIWHIVNIAYAIASGG